MNGKETHQNVESSIQDLQKRIEKLENGGKDIWDILHIIGSLLLPLAIAYAGYWFSAKQQAIESFSMNQQQKAQRELNAANIEIARSNENTAKIQARVEQSLAVSDLIQPLSSYTNLQSDKY